MRGCSGLPHRRERDGATREGGDGNLLGDAFGSGKYDDAAKIFADLVNNDTFVEFLTLPAYERID